MAKKYLLGFSIIIAFIILTSTTVFAQCDKTKLTPIQCGYFEQGYQDGIKDAKDKVENNYKRHKDNFDKKNETFYSQGYQQGFNTITPFVRWDKFQHDFYDRGYENGKDDKRKNISQLPARYEGKYAKSYEPYFIKGYNDGYENKVRQYDTQIIVTENKNPQSNDATPQLSNPVEPTNNNNSNLNGSFLWTGKIDEKISFVLKGNEVLISDMSGAGYKENSRKLFGVLPNRPAEISAKIKDGRGEVVVLQQPNRQNDYTAIVQLVNKKLTSENFRLEIFWLVNNTEETYQKGTVFWSGKVDQTADIKIIGKDVKSIDVDGTGLMNVSSNLSGFLARRIINVNVQKIRGRGAVSVVQQPNWENDFTAIVRISDTEKGASDYQIEINW
jgi:hypothetical protein